MAELSERIVTGVWRDADAAFRCDRLIVSVKRGAPISSTLDSVRTSIVPEVEGAQLIHRSGRPWAVLQFQPLADAGTRIPRILEKLALRSDLRYAEPDFVCNGHFIPDDVKYPGQWWMHKVEIESLWTATRGSSRVLLAIADSGISMSKGSVNPDHEDLRGNRFSVRHRRWFLPVSHDYVVPGQLPRDEHGHGTHITGIAAATGDNMVGIAGANWRSPVYVARVLDGNNQGSASLVKLAVDDILEYGAGDSYMSALFRFLSASRIKRVVINLSLGFPDYAHSLREMCEETAGGDVVVCVAADSRVESTTELDYPAAFAADFCHVIAVGATDANDSVKAPMGMANCAAITIFAPGQDIESTFPTYRCPLVNASQVEFAPYGTGSGTSQACALVSGGISLWWSQDDSLQAAEIRRHLIDMAVPIVYKGVQYPRLRLSAYPHTSSRWWIQPVRRILGARAAPRGAARLR
jgi:subtilisin family serine protease